MDIYTKVFAVNMLVMVVTAVVDFFLFKNALEKSMTIFGVDLMQLWFKLSMVSIPAMIIYWTVNF